MESGGTISLNEDPVLIEPSTITMEYKVSPLLNITYKIPKVSLFYEGEDVIQVKVNDLIVQ